MAARPGYNEATAADDLGQLQATMQAIELACNSIQMHVNPAAAEATLVSLSQSARPYQTCQFIIENSQLATARFQAAGAIRDAAIREWAFLEADDRRGLISFCLRYIMKYAGSPEGYVLVKVASVAAQLLKRGWLDFTAVEKEAFFLEVKQGVNGDISMEQDHTKICQYLKLILLHLWMPCTAFPVQKYFLIFRSGHSSYSFVFDTSQAFYSWVQHAAFNVSNRIIAANSEVPEVKVSSVALRLMLQILNWDSRLFLFLYSKRNVREK